MKRLFLSVFLLLALLSCRQQPEAVQHNGIQFLPMESERLPDLSEPRTYHALVWAGDHLLAVGGHTTGFIPSATAEYFSGRRWHSIPMIYTHDSPFALTLKNGDVMVGGGYEKPFGVGQTWGVEVYHPEKHIFTPSCIMDRKRARCSALEMENGEILICGNWYDLDVIEKYHAKRGSVTIDTASESRNYPLVIPVGSANAYIFSGSCGSRGENSQYVVDQLDGEPFTVELFKTWHPCSSTDRNVQVDACRMADDTFLILVANDEEQCAPMVVDPRGFSLLPLNHALPQKGPWGTIHYISSFWTNPETKTAWLMGVDDDKRAYFAEIQYEPYLQGHEAALTMHYSQPIEGLPNVPWEMMLPDGSFVSVGGSDTNNYEPNAHVFAFYPSVKPQHRSLTQPWVIALVAVIGLMLIGFLAYKVMKPNGPEPPQRDDTTSSENNSSNERQDLSSQIKALMEERQLFKNKDLRIADVAAALGTNTTYISTCLNGVLNTNFPAFVTGYRIRHAQELMRHHPTMRLSEVAEESGFANEKTFLRAFKASCGLTPSEWKQQQAPQTEG